MAYVLGYFVADGCVSTSQRRPNNPYTFNITSKDLEHLQNICKVLHSNYKISKKSGSSSNIAYQIQIRNSVLAKDLMKLGIYPRKTYNLGVLNIPKSYFADFVRGFFDGDGTVYIYNVNGVKQLKSGFVSVSLDFMEDFNVKLCKALGIIEKPLHRSVGKPMMQYTSCFYIDDSKKLAQLMYGKKPLLYLERKKEIFDKWDAIKKATRKKNFTKKNYPSKIGWRLSEGVKVN